MYVEDVKNEDPYEDAPSGGFQLKQTTEMHLTHVGYTIDAYPEKVWSWVPKEMQKRDLSKKHRSLLLVETPATRDFEKYAWAAIRPERTTSWEIHAQPRGEGYLPPGFSPSLPEPPKHYQNKKSVALMTPKKGMKRSGWFSGLLWEFYVLPTLALFFLPESLRIPIL